MIYPILAYGHPTLNKIAKDIDKDYPGLKQLIDDMFETMYAAHGVGLAAPQINISIRLVVMDASAFGEDYPDGAGFRKVFINPHIIEKTGEKWSFEEGCLSVPGIHENVMREETITVEYDDENFEHHLETFGGVCARVMQHEFDHLDGKLFVDRLGSLRRTMIKKKLENISKGLVSADYKMIFPLEKKKR